MGRPGGNPGNKGGGRKGYNHQIVIEQAYEIVRAGLYGELKTIDEKQQFGAAVELVKKAMPTNLEFGLKTLEAITGMKIINNGNTIQDKDSSTE